jgi:hypothetical protein
LHAGPRGLGRGLRLRRLPRQQLVQRRGPLQQPGAAGDDRAGTSAAGRKPWGGLSTQAKPQGRSACVQRWHRTPMRDAAGRAQRNNVGTHFASGTPVVLEAVRTSIQAAGQALPNTGQPKAAGGVGTREAHAGHANENHAVQNGGASRD